MKLVITVDLIGGNEEDNLAPVIAKQLVNEYIKEMAGNPIVQESIARVNRDLRRNLKMGRRSVAVVMDDPTIYSITE